MKTISLARKTKYNTPEKLNDFLNSFRYGYVDKHGKAVTNGDFSDYITISPKDFMKYKIGICWDFATFEYWFFNTFLKDKATDIKLYYIEVTDNGKILSTHTWLTYKNLNGNICIFESSWGIYQGITKFKTEREMLAYYKWLFLKDLPKNYIIINYIPPSKFGMTPLEFITYIRENGTIIENHNIDI